MSTRKLHHHLYFWVVLAIVAGVILGATAPQLAQTLKPLGDLFIKLVKMVIAPIVFVTVVVGIAGMGDMKRVGRVGVKALLYFEVMTTFALAIGLVVVNTLKPGAGMNVDATKLDVSAIASYTQAAKGMTVSDYFLHMVPNTVVGAFAEGEILQVLVFSVLFGFALAGLGDRGRPLVSLIDHVAQALFGVVGLIMKVAPIGAFGAMAFTIGKFGLGTLVSLGKLMAGVYLTSALFVLVVLGAVLALFGLNIFRFLGYLKEEILIVLGTSSSESVLPRMMAKMEALGCDRSVVGLTVPTGYSFNLDGTCIYLTMAAVFIAQATNTPLTLTQELTILFVLMLTSKGAATVTGGGFITLAATLASIGTPPVAGLVLLVGIDRFMSEARALTNMVGNGVATVVVARWENALDLDRARRVLAGEVEAEPDAGTRPSVGSGLS